MKAQQKSRLIEVFRFERQFIAILCFLALSSCNTTDEVIDCGTVLDYASEIGTATLLVLENGKPIIEFGDLDYPYMCHSIRKPFLSALYGIFVERGLIDIDMTLEELQVDDLPPSLTAIEKSATVKDLLLARSGIYHEAAGESLSMIESRPTRGSHLPGTFFYYNNWDFNALGTIFEHQVGDNIFDSFYNEIAQPIGMNHFNPDDCTYVYETSKSEHPSYFFRMSTRDMARFGLLYIHKGSWDRRQIIPEEWIEESTAIYPIRNNLYDPYGYLWMIVPEESSLENGYYHTGYRGHLLGVLPERKLVIVHRVDTDFPFDSVSLDQVRILVEMVLEKIDD